MGSGNEIDDLIRKAIRETGLESPSPGFTARVLDKMAREPGTCLTLYRPLFPKYVWWLLLLGLLGLVGLSYTGHPGTDLKWIPTLPSDLIPNITFFSADWKISLPSTFYYGILALASALCLQLFILKGYRESRLSH